MQFWCRSYLDILVFVPIKIACIAKEQIEMQKRITQIEEAREQERAIQSRKANLQAELQKLNEITIVWLSIILDKEQHAM